MSRHEEHLSSYLARLKGKSAAAAGYMPPEQLPAPPVEPVAAGAVRTAKAHRTRAAKAAKQAARRRDAYTGLGDVSGVLSRHAVRWRLRLHGGEGSAEFPPEAATAVKPDAAFDTRMALALLRHARRSAPWTLMDATYLYLGSLPSQRIQMRRSGSASAQHRTEKPVAPSDTQVSTSAGCRSRALLMAGSSP